MTASVFVYQIEGSDPPLLKFRPKDLQEEQFQAYKDALSGCAFNREHRAYVASSDRAHGVVTRLRRAGLDVLTKGPATGTLERVAAEKWLDLQGVKERIAYLDDELGRRTHPVTGKVLRLLPYQKEGIEWLALRTRAVLADDQGLGKSCQVITALPPGAPVLVVCPKSVKLVWAQEVSTWRPSLRTFVVRDRESFRWPDSGEMGIVSFELLPAVHAKDCKRDQAVECPGCSPIYVGGVQAHLPTCRVGQKAGCEGCGRMPSPKEGTVLVVDELHFARNPKALRSANTRGLATACLKAGGRAWGATGTPLVNQAEDLWNVLEVVDCAREAYGTYRQFVEVQGGTPKMVETFVRGKGRQEVQKGWTWGDPQPEAAERLQRVALRRLKKDVLKDLPPKTHRFVPVEVSKEVASECDAALRSLGSLEEFLNLKKVPFELVSRVRAALAEAKIPAMLELVELAEACEDPLIVFSSHRNPVLELQGRPGWEVILGGVSDKARKRVVDAFQGGELKGVALTCKAGGTGLTLTRSSHELFVDRPWTVADMVQCEDRAHRHGQTRGLLIEVLVARHALDERVNEILLAKARRTHQSVDAAAVSDLDQEPDRAVEEDEYE